jgi:hypothetical protein
MASAWPAAAQSFPPAFVNCSLTKTNGTFTTSGQPNVTATFLGTWVSAYNSPDQAPPANSYGTADLGWSVPYPYDASLLCEGVALSLPTTGTGELGVDLDNQNAPGDTVADTYTLDQGRLTLHAYTEAYGIASGSEWASMPPSHGTSLPTTSQYWCFQLSGTAGKYVTCHIAQAYQCSEQFMLYSGQSATISTTNVLSGTVTNTVNGPATVNYGPSGWSVGSDIVVKVQLNSSGLYWVYVPMYCGRSIQASGSGSTPTLHGGSTYEVRLYSAVVSST